MMVLKLAAGAWVDDSKGSECHVLKSLRHLSLLGLVGGDQRLTCERRHDGERKECES